MVVVVGVVVVAVVVVVGVVVVAVVVVVGVMLVVVIGGRGLVGLVVMVLPLIVDCVIAFSLRLKARSLGLA